MKIVKGKVDKDVRFTVLPFGAVFKPLEGTHSGRLYMKIQSPVDGACLFNAVRMDSGIHKTDWFQMSEKVEEVAAQLVVEWSE